MAPSRNSSSRPPSSALPISPELRYLRAIRYWHQHGKFIHDQPGFDQATCTIKKPRTKRTKVISYQDPLIPHPPTPTSALAHTYTSTQSPTRTSTQPHAVEVALLYKKNLLYRPPEPEEYASDADLGRTPYFLIPIVRDSREERESLDIKQEDYGKRWKSTYRYLIGDTPDCGPGDHDQAQRYWYKIREALDGEYSWTPAERARLRAMELKWRKRKDGQDPRFETVGNRRGGLDGPTRREFHDRRILEDIARLARTHWRAVRDS